MNTSTLLSKTPAYQAPVTDISAASPAYQAFRLLHLGFVAAPILAGLDKFFHLLVNWDQYVPSVVARLSPIGVHQLSLVAGWLAVIITNLLLIPGYFDVALRDFGLFLAALALARLSQQFSHA